MIMPLDPATERSERLGRGQVPGEHRLLGVEPPQRVAGQVERDQTGSGPGGQVVPVEHVVAEGEPATAD